MKAKNSTGVNMVPRKSVKIAAKDVAGPFAYLIKLYSFQNH